MKNIILAILLVSSVQTFAANNNTRGNDGGGGGGFCFEGKKCVTLAEAGFRIQKSEQSYEKPQLALPAEVFVEAYKVIDMLPVQSAYKTALKNSLGDQRTYVRTVSYDSKAMKKIKKEYVDLLKTHNLNSANLVIYALSTRTQTYILPEFETLNLRSKALIIIHEAVVRKTGSVLRALKLDGAILDLLAGKNSFYDFTDAIQDEGYTPGKWNSISLYTYATSYAFDHNKYLNVADLMPVSALQQFGRMSYCLSALEEISLYEKHYTLYQKMKSANMNMCFEFDQRINVDPVSLELSTPGYSVQFDEKLVTSSAQSVCQKVVNGDVITDINIKEISSNATHIWDEIFPKSPLVLECKNQQLISMRTMHLRAN